MNRKNYGLYTPKTYEGEFLDRWEKIETKDVSKELQHKYKGGMPKKYKIKKANYKHLDKNYWGISIITIYKDEKFLCDFIRNYQSSWDAIFVRQNGNDFLVTSSDYQCITIVNLENGEVKAYTDIDDRQYGCGFCPIEFDWDEDTLYIEGCVWACPTEKMIVKNIDLLHPEEAFNNAEWECADDDNCYCDIDDDDDYNDDDADCMVD